MDCGTPIDVHCLQRLDEIQHDIHALRASITCIQTEVKILEAANKPRAMDFMMYKLMSSILSSLFVAVCVFHISYTDY